jgi:V/A-type H+-transporting ATPase subunit K
MVTKRTLAKIGLLAVVFTAVMWLGAPMAMAAEGEAAAGAAEGSSGLAAIGLGIGAGLAVGLAGIGTGLAQSGVGAGGTGTLAEKPELFGRVVALFAIPETIVILGFALGYLMFAKI